MSYIITDIDGTLTTTGDTPRQPLIDWLKSRVQDYADEVIVVSARNIDRLAETKEWLDANDVPYKEIHLQDFGESNPAVNEAFKAYKYSKLQEEYGDEIELVIDNDPEARDAAEGMGIDAYTPEEILRGEADGEDDDESDEARVVIDVPDYISAAAAKGLTYYENGYAGDGLQPETVEEARLLRSGKAEDEKITRMRAWILRHRQDWEGVPRNSDAANDEFPGPGAVAGYLWGVEVTDPNGADRVLQWADRVLNTLENNERFDVKEFERRALPMGDFTVDDT